MNESEKLISILWTILIQFIEGREEREGVDRKLSIH